MRALPLLHLKQHERLSPHRETGERTQMPGRDHYVAPLGVPCDPPIRDNENVIHVPSQKGPQWPAVRRPANRQDATERAPAAQALDAEEECAVSSPCKAACDRRTALLIKDQCHRS